MVSIHDLQAQLDSLLQDDTKHLTHLKCQSDSKRKDQQIAYKDVVIGSRFPFIHNYYHRKECVGAHSIIFASTLIYSTNEHQGVYNCHHLSGLNYASYEFLVLLQSPLSIVYTGMSSRSFILLPISITCDFRAPGRC